jgi:hypothetical protein
MTQHNKQMAALLEIRTKVVDQCSKTMEDGAVQNCSRVTEELFCNACPQPDKKWKLGDCNMSDPFLKTEASKTFTKIRAGQQKQKKKHRR